MVRNVLFILGSSLLWPIAAARQPAFGWSDLELIAPADPSVSASTYDIGRQPALARFFQSRESAPLSRYSIVLTNESVQHIVGAAVRWIVTDRSGQSRTTTLSFDSFGTSLAARKPVIPAGTQLIATANGFQQVKVLSGTELTFGAGSAGGIPSFGFGRGQFVRINELDQAEHITAVVDTIIFEDGRVVGRDESHLTDYINAIAAAVKTLVQNIRTAISDGRDVNEFLRNIVSKRRTSSAASFLDDPALFWTIREADLLLRLSADQRRGRLDQLEALADPPVFYR